MPVALAAATATYVGRHLFGNQPAFAVPPVHPDITAAVLPAYVVLGVLTAVLSVVFISSLYGGEDFFERRIPRHDYLRHVAGMLGVGITIAATMALSGHYYVQGVGYATIVDVLTGVLTSPWALVALCATKLLTTTLTLGSGGSGGVFSPSLFMGATLGGAFGLVLRMLFPGIPFDPAAFALAGMAGLVAGATGAALTAIVMTFEMTLDYSVVLPMTLTVAVSHGLRRLMLAQNIYTMKLVRRGHYMPEALQANAVLVHHVGDMTMATAAERPARAPAEAPPEADAGKAPEYDVLIDGETIVGVVPTQRVADKADARGGPGALADLARKDFVVVPSDTTIFDLIAAMQRAAAELAVVLPTDAERRDGAPRVRGIVTKSDIAEAMAEGMEIFED